MKNRPATAGVVAALLALACLAAPARGQTRPEEMPGYVPVEFLDVLAADDVSIEINLRGAMLRMISSLTGDEDPEFAALVAGLDAVRVRSGEFDPQQLERVRDGVAAGQRWLREHGWLAMLKVQEDSDEVYIYTRELDDEIVGLAILALESSEVTTINLVGRIDPDGIGRLAEGFAVDLEDLQDRIDAGEER